ncbi:MAG: response regulator, partial [Gallionellaceae bacterium]|nr:response regulator [Gallionellaceae bacterium]
MHDSEALAILVVEDNADLAANIADYLEGRGHLVDTALDGVTGLHLAVAQPHDVIVLDLMLPGIDGLTLCRRLRQDARSPVPVLMLTARVTLDDKVAG